MLASLDAPFRRFRDQANSSIKLSLGFMRGRIYSELASLSSSPQRHKKANQGGISQRDRRAGMPGSSDHLPANVMTAL